MTASTDLAPGFRMTEIGPLPEEWEVACIGDLFDMRQGKSLSPRSRLGLSPVPFLRTANVLWGRVDLAKVDRMDFSEREVEVYSLRPQDLLVCEGGDVGRTAFWNGALDLCCYQNHLHRLRAKRGDVWPSFYAFWMQAALTLLGLYVGAENRSTIPNLSQARLRVFAVPKPPLPEQRNIAAVLDTVRRAIETTEKVVAAAKELKRSLLQYLFTYGPVPHDAADRVSLKETEIGSMPEGWDMVQLGDVMRGPLRNGIFVKRPSWGQGVRYLNVADIYASATVDTRRLQRLALSRDAGERFEVVEGDVVFVRSSLKREGVARACMVPALEEPVIFDCHLIRMSPDPARVNSQYLAEYCRSELVPTCINQRKIV